MRRRAGRARSIRSLRCRNLQLALVYLEVVLFYRCEALGELRSDQAAKDVVVSV
jgi:hypothetical protein